MGKLDELYSVREIAEMAKLHPVTIRRHIKEGKLTPIKVGGSVRISQKEKDRFLTGKGR